jgi:hypothetical protein
MRSLVSYSKHVYSSQLIDGPNKLECYITLGWQGLLETYALYDMCLYDMCPLVSYEENEIFWISLAQNEQIIKLAS